MKYYATIGPNFNSVDDLINASELGMNGVRVNLSHGNLDEISPWIQNIKIASETIGYDLEIILDVVGPELRIKLLNDIAIGKNQKIKVFSKNKEEKEVDSIYVNEELIENAVINDILIVDDSSIELLVVEKNLDYLLVEALDNYILKTNKSISIKDKLIDLNCYSESDVHNFYISKEYDINSFMQPFVRRKDDIIQLRQKLEEIGIHNSYIYAKIEDNIGINNIVDII